MRVACGRRSSFTRLNVGQSLAAAAGILGARWSYDPSLSHDYSIHPATVTVSQESSCPILSKTSVEAHYDPESSTLSPSDMSKDVGAPKVSCGQKFVSALTPSTRGKCTLANYASKSYKCSDKTPVVLASVQSKSPSSLELSKSESCKIPSTSTTRKSKLKRSKHRLTETNPPEDLIAEDISVPTPQVVDDRDQPPVVNFAVPEIAEKIDPKSVVKSTAKECLRRTADWLKQKLSPQTATVNVILSGAPTGPQPELPEMNWETGRFNVKFETLKVKSGLITKEDWLIPSGLKLIRQPDRKRRGIAEFLHSKSDRRVEIERRIVRKEDKEKLIGLMNRSTISRVLDKSPNFRNIDHIWTRKCDFEGNIEVYFLTILNDQKELSVVDRQNSSSNGRFRLLVDTVVNGLVELHKYGLIMGSISDEDLMWNGNRWEFINFEKYRRVEFGNAFEKGWPQARRFLCQQKDAKGQTDYVWDALSKVSTRRPKQEYKSIEGFLDTSKTDLEGDLLLYAVERLIWEDKRSLHTGGIEAVKIGDEEFEESSWMSFDDDAEDWGSFTSVSDSTDSAVTDADELEEATVREGLRRMEELRRQFIHECIPKGGVESDVVLSDVDKFALALRLEKCVRDWAEQVGVENGPLMKQISKEWYSRQAKARG